MDWNYERKEYCKYWRSFGGTYKAPEEYDGAYLDETVDIWYVDIRLSVNDSDPITLLCPCLTLYFSPSFAGPWET